jgi:nucleoid-associated protein Lsr2
VEVGFEPTEGLPPHTLSSGSEGDRRLQDDLDRGPADETVRFGFGGTDYEIDLNEKNSHAFRTQLEPFVGHARKAGRRPTLRSPRTAAGRQRSGEVRSWAQSHGIALSARGRIPASVLEQYEAATGR